MQRLWYDKHTARSGSTAHMMCEESVGHGSSSSDVLPFSSPTHPAFFIEQLQRGDHGCPCHSLHHVVRSASWGGVSGICWLQSWCCHGLIYASLSTKMHNSYPRPPCHLQCSRPKNYVWGWICNVLPGMPCCWCSCLLLWPSWLTTPRANAIMSPCRHLHFVLQVLKNEALPNWDTALYRVCVVLVTEVSSTSIVPAQVWKILILDKCRQVTSFKASARTAWWGRGEKKIQYNIWCTI